MLEGVVIKRDKMKKYFVLLILVLIHVQPAISQNKAHWLDEYKDTTELFNSDGFRITRYRSPSPPDSEDAILINTEELHSLLSNTPNPILFDVLPLVTAQGVFVQRKERLNIPNSYWLPNVGKGVLGKANEAYFRYYLERYTGADKNKPIVMYCRADCWMSWNAVKRAKNWGYSNLYWYRDGMNGWRDADLRQVSSTPEPQLHDLDR